MVCGCELYFSIAVHLSEAFNCLRTLKNEIVPCVRKALRAPVGCWLFMISRGEKPTHLSKQSSQNWNWTRSAFKSVHERIQTVTSFCSLDLKNCGIVNVFQLCTFSSIKKLFCRCRCLTLKRIFQLFLWFNQFRETLTVKFLWVSRSFVRGRWSGREILRQQSPVSQMRIFSSHKF